VLRRHKVSPELLIYREEVLHHHKVKPRVVIIRPEKKNVNGLLNIMNLFNLIRLLNYEIGNNYYVRDLSYCGIYNNYLSDLGNYG